MISCPLLLSVVVTLASPTLPFAADPLDSLLDAASNPKAVRASLIAFARQPAGNPALTARAWRLAGDSFDRGGRLDSALVCYEQAAAFTADGAAQDALAEALLARGLRDDVARAESLMVERVRRARSESSADLYDAIGRLAWARHLAGEADSAGVLFDQVRHELLDDRNPLRWVWRYRIVANLAHRDAREAFEIAKPLLTRSRLTDDGLISIVMPKGDAASRDAIPMLLRGDIVMLEREDEALRQSIGATRVDFRSYDGFPVGGVVLAPEGGGRPRRAAIAIANREGAWWAYDTLATDLRKAGYAVMLMEPRGSGHSLGAACPTPESWRGREDDLSERTAHDVPFALRALAHATGADTTAYVLIGDRDVAAIAARAAALDRRVLAVVLTSPEPDEVERGAVRAWLTSRPLPVFLETAVIDAEARHAADRIYRALDPTRSRLVESMFPGSGAEVFRLDTSAGPRLSSWLAEQPAPGPKGATRPARRR